MANPSVSIDDELWEAFVGIVKAKEAAGELESDARSPVVQDLIQEYVDENQDDLRRWREFAAGNGSRRHQATVTAD